MMNWSALLLAAIWIQPAHAFLGSGDTDIQPVYSCFGLDGIPIPSGSAMYNQCCSNGRLNPGASSVCRAGFHTISGDSAGGAAGNITLAQQTLGVASTLNGVQTDINLTNAPHSDPNTVNPVHATSSALIGGAMMNNDGSGLKGSAFGKSRGRGGSGAGGAGSGGGGEGGGFSGLGGGSGGSGSGKNGNGTDPNDSTNKPIGGGFASAGGNGKDGNGGGFGSGDLNLGGNGSGADGNGNGMEELNMGGDDDALAEGEAGSDVEGTIHDPDNYFALTNKGDDLFKIVSRRYTKKYKKLVMHDKSRLPSGKSAANKPL